MKRSKGIRQASRSRLRKNVRDKGMPSISRMLKTFKEGENVAIKIEPAIHKGMPYHKFQGRTGKIIGMRGDAYLVKFMDGKKTKTIISRPVHLKRV